MVTRTLRISTLFVLPLVLGACAMNAVNLRFTVHDDGSGDVTLVRFRAPETSPLAGTLRGVARTMAFGLEVVGGPFENVENVSIGGIQGRLSREGDGFAFRLAIPLGKDAPWIGEVGLQAAEIQRMRRLGETMRSIDEPDETQKKLADMDLERPAYVFAVKLPGSIESTHLVGRELPEGWELSEVGDPMSSRQAHLVVPFQDAVTGTGTLLWETRCAAPDEDAAQEKDKTRRWLEQR